MKGTLSENLEENVLFLLLGAHSTDVYFIRQEVLLNSELEKQFVCRGATMRMGCALLSGYRRLARQGLGGVWDKYFSHITEEVVSSSHQELHRIPRCFASPLLFICCSSLVFCSSPCH